MKNCLLAPFAMVGAMLLCSAAIGFADEKTLQIARNLAGKEFAGFKYGSEGIDKKQIDCVQFVLAVVEKRLGRVAGATRRDILIAHGWTKDEEQKLADKGTDERLAGVQKALVQAQKGLAVDKSDVQAGDLVQYWIKRKDGSWFGHAAVIQSVKAGKVVLLGAHQSKGGIAELDLNLDKVDRLFLVRILANN